MELTNMIMQQLQGKVIEEIAGQVGGNSDMVKKIAGQALPQILKQFEKKSEDATEAEALNNALDAHTSERPGGFDIADGKKILGHLFGNSESAVKDVAKNSGADEETTSGIMGALSSVVMETLGNQKKAAGGLQTSDLMKMLSGVGKDTNFLSAMLDQDGDGDLDAQDAMKFGLGMLKKKLFGRK